MNPPKASTRFRLNRSERLSQTLLTTSAVIVSSHQINEVEQTCDRVAILVDGRLISHHAINQQTRQIKLDFSTPIDDLLLSQLSSCFGVTQVAAIEPSTYILTTTDTEQSAHALIALCASNKLPLTKMVSDYSDLHDIFFQKTFHSGAIGMIRAICQAEFRRLSRSPKLWLIIALMMFLLGYLLLTFLDHFLAVIASSNIGSATIQGATTSVALPTVIWAGYIIIGL